jgi:cytochrome P450
MVYDDDDVRTVLQSEHVDSWWPAGTSELVGPASLNVLPPPRQATAKAVFLRAFGERAVGGYLPAVARAAVAVLDAWVDAGGSSSSGGSSGASNAAAAAALGGLPAARQALPLCDILASATFHAALLGEAGGASDAASDAALVAAAVERAALAAALAGGFVPPMVDLPFAAFGRALAARRELLARYSAAASAARARRRQQRRPAVAAAAIDVLVQPAAAAAAISEEELLDGIMACLFGNAGAGPTALKLFQYLTLQAAEDGQEQQQQQGAEWWRRLRDEQRRVVAERGARLDAAALDAMPLAEAVVREVLRITPVVPAMFRV